jgi:hypothetical protein
VTWPDPAANALDRARAVARAYRAALHHAAPQAARLIDEGAHRVGESWVADISAGDSCTVRQAAALLGVNPSRVRQLIGAGALRSAGKDRDGHVLMVADVLAYQSLQRVASHIRN